MAFFIPFVLGVVVGRALTWPGTQRGESASTTSSPRPLLPVSTTQDVEPEQGAASVEPPTASLAAEVPVRRQALEQIQGLGPIDATRLREAGVRTFADLAALTPGRVIEIAMTDRDASERSINAEDWIRQARTLAEGHENGS